MLYAHYKNKYLCFSKTKSICNSLNCKHIHVHVFSCLCRHYEINFRCWRNIYSIKATNQKATYWQYDKLKYIRSHELHILCFFLQERALDYLSTCIDQVNTFGDILQLVIVELIYKVCVQSEMIYFLILIEITFSKCCIWICKIIKQ